MGPPVPVTHAAQVPPPRPSVRELFFTVRGIGSRWPAATRSMAALAVPAVILWFAGLGHEALFAALGSFGVLYGENRPYRIRWRVIVIASAVMIASVAIMSTLGHVVGTDSSTTAELGIVAVSVVIAGLAVYAGNALRLGPPGPLFVVLTGGIAATVARHGVAPLVLIGCTAAGAAGSLVAGMSPALLGRSRPQLASVDAAIAAIDDYIDADAPRSSPLRHGASGHLLHAWSVLHDAAETDSALAQQLWASHERLHRGSTPMTDATAGTFPTPLPRPTVRQRLRASAHPRSHAAIAAMRVMVAAAAAGGLSVALGLTRPDWAIVAVVLVLQLGPDRIRGALRGAHRLAGTAVGLVLFALLHAAQPTTIALIGILAVLSFTIEITVVSNYGLAATAITPLALLMSATGPAIWEPARDRLIETALGVVLGVAALWIVDARAHRRTTRWTRDEAVDDVVTLLDLLETRPPDTDEGRVRRRDVQWALMEAEMAATESAIDDPAWARDDWPAHVRLRHLGYETLAECWKAAPGTTVDRSALSELRALSDRVS
ncbi:FUSC family protein [Williamsia phyllosphaerae]|nr:FUSC family protein [Williamsia phyllosphaerae]